MPSTGIKIFLEVSHHLCSIYNSIQRDIKKKKLPSRGQHLSTENQRELKTDTVLHGCSSCSPWCFCKEDTIDFYCVRKAAWPWEAAGSIYNPKVSLQVCQTKSHTEKGRKQTRLFYFFTLKLPRGNSTDLWRWQVKKDHKDIRLCREKITRATAQTEFNLTTAVKDTKHFNKYISKKRKTKEILHSSLDAQANTWQWMRRRQKYFASGFNSKTSRPHGTQTGTERRNPHKLGWNNQWPATPPAHPHFYRPQRDPTQGYRGRWQRSVPSHFQRIIKVGKNFQDWVQPLNGEQNHNTKCHIQLFLQHFQVTPHFPVQPVPRLSHPFCEKFLPDAQPPLLACQNYGLPERRGWSPTTSFQIVVEGNKVFPESPFLQVEYPQLSHLLFTF